MTTNKNIDKYLWFTVVMFATYLFLGSFIVSKDFFDLIYLIVLYLVIIASKFIDRKK